MILDDMGSETGVSAQGSTTPDQVKPQDIDRAFSANEKIDPGSEMPEAGQTPIRNKVAMSTYVTLAGRLAALQRFGLEKAAEALTGLAPLKPVATTPTKPPKPVQATDPRTDKPPGYGLVSGVQTMSNGADVNDSYGAFSRRLQGSPV